ncbi:MAG: DUF3053 family protein [Bacillota bacterium]|nr:DUF3053 family protein [Bacillota bacterium]
MYQGGITIKKYVYINGNERVAIENVELFQVFLRSGKITKDTFLFDEEIQNWVSVLQIPEFATFFQYAPNSQPFYGNNQQQGFPQNQPYQASYQNFQPPVPVKKTPLYVTIAIIAGIAAFVAVGFLTGLFKKHTDTTTAAHITDIFSSTTQSESTSSGSDSSDNSSSSSKEMRAVQKMVSIMQDLNNNVPISEEQYSSSEYGQLAPVLKEFQNYYIKLQKERNRIQDEVTKLDVNSIFTEENLGNLDNIKTTEDNLRNYLDDYKTYEQNYKQYTAEYKDNIMKLDLPEASKNNFLQSFNKSNDQVMVLMDKFFTAEESFINNMIQIMTFLEGKQGEYDFSGGQIQFYSDDDVNTYNNYYTEMQNAANQEVDIQKQMTQMSQKTLDNLKSAQ